MTKTKKDKDVITINLASWIRTQRGQYRKGKLSADRVKRLDELNISW